MTDTTKAQILDLARKAINTEMLALKHMKETLGDNFADAVELILACSGKCIVTGMGKSGLVGRKIAATLASTGTPSFFLHPGEAFHGDLGMISKDDVVLALSYSGETDEILKIVPFIHSNGNKLVSMTGNPESALAKNSDIHLDVSVEEEACILHLAPTTSTTAQIAMGDALAVSLMQMRGFTSVDFARLHPGGSLGRRLLMTVGNVMRSHDLPVVAPDCSATDMIHAISKGGLGFLTDAQKSQSKKVTIDDTGAKTVISSRLGTMMTTDVTVEYGTDAMALQAYNQKNGTDYQLLPEKFYSFSESTTTIKAGEIGSSPTNLIIKPFDETIDATKKYAIPVAIVNANGAEKLLSSSSLIVLLDQIIVTTVPYLANGNAISIVPEPMIEELSSWTLEWNLCVDAFNRNNVTQWTIKGADGKNNIYTRFGDVTCEQNQFQAKIGSGKPQSITRFTANKWYHLALTYDGTNIRFYVDGVLDFTTPHALPGEVFEMKEIGFANSVNTAYTLKGSISELRVWSVARSQAEISNNMYVVSPQTPRLEVYWKCNEGSGTIIKDYSSHQRDGKLVKETTWKTGVRFPDDGE